MQQGGRAGIGAEAQHISCMLGISSISPPVFHCTLRTWILLLFSHQFSSQRNKVIMLSAPMSQQVF